MCSMVEFNKKTVEEAIKWFRSVTAGGAEERGVVRYAKKVTFDRFISSWLLVNIHSGSGFRKHTRQFHHAGFHLAPSSISHYLNKRQQLVPLSSGSLSWW